MGKRKNVTIETAERPFPKVTSARKRQIARLYDAPATVRQIAEETQLPMTVVRRALQEMVPADGNRWLEL